MKKILVVDNNPVMLEFMRELLQEEGYEVRLAENGLKALQLVEEAVPDVVFVDLVMPQIDGKQLTRLLRAKTELDQSYIVIVSGVAAECGSDKVSAPADAHIAKSPFKVMRGHILKVLKDFEEGKRNNYGQRVVGCDELYQREITNELLYSKHHLEYLIANLDNGFIELTRDGIVIFSNPAASRLLHTEESLLVTSYFPGFFSLLDKKRVEDILSSIGEQPIVAGEEEPFVLYNRLLLLRFLPIHYEDYNSVSVILQDITRRKEAETVIRESLTQKETLLQEVHHRVKNNLTVIASLLSLQTTHTDDEEVQKHLLDSKNRVESMALVHERLYNSDDLSGIDLQGYIEGITRRLIEVYQNSDDHIIRSLSIPKVTVPMELAVPLGLIINELVSNSLEHAFPVLNGGKSGKISLNFCTEEQEEGDLYRIRISDDGRGLPEDFHFNEEETTSLGLLLVHTLAQQIHGSFRFEEKEKGIAASVVFPVQKWRSKLHFEEER